MCESCRGIADPWVCGGKRLWVGYKRTSKVVERSNREAFKKIKNIKSSYIYGEMGKKAHVKVWERYIPRKGLRGP